MRGRTVWSREFALVLYSVLLIHSVLSYKVFQSRIPNGANIPNPCNPSRIWNGVGHQNTAGAGKRNPFGQDFERFGKMWDKTLCEMDSDGDGVTNGQELGDPDCVWTENQVPKHSSGLSHPGVCDVRNSTECKTKNFWLKCDSDKFRCDAVKEDGVKKHTLRLPPTEVPINKTTYICMRFELPSDGDYHIIAEEPIIDNDYVLHHMILFGCEDLESYSFFWYNKLYRWFKVLVNRPFFCNMSPGKYCKEILCIWSFGSAGHCGSRHAGFRIGKKGFKYAAIQIHWNNPEKRADYIDSSGILLYYTPNLRPYDAGILTIGQMMLEIPPKMEHYEITALCDQECSTVLLKAPIYLFEGMNHMHYLGKSEKVEVFRNQTWHKEITNDEIYAYDNPVSHLYHSAVEIQPGDEIKTTCAFNSINMDNTTYFGEDTSAEMCFAFLSYYPIGNIEDNMCLSWRTLPYCKLNTKLNFTELNGCNVTMLTDFRSKEMQNLFLGIYAKCKPQVCLPKCLALLKDTYEKPCFQGEMKEFALDYLSRSNGNVTQGILSRIDPCNKVLESSVTTESVQTEPVEITKSDQTETPMVTTELVHTEPTTADHTKPPMITTKSGQTELLTTPSLAYGKGKKIVSSLLYVMSTYIFTCLLF